MYKLLITNEECDPSTQNIEVVERKGVGHPDSVADIIAETMSNEYSRYSLDKFGIVLNHWFDKVLISGGEALLSPGGSQVVKKPRVYLFGKVTNVTDFDFPLEKLFTKVVHEVFKKIFNVDGDLAPDISIDVNSGVGSEHDKDFYTFGRENPHTPSTLLSNDTVFCCGYYSYSKLESFVVDLENYINSQIFKSMFPSTGFDVKILAVRNIRSVTITICVPFIAGKIASWDDYNESKRNVEIDLYAFCEKYSWDSVRILLNSKDTQGKGYLTVYGSALDKGDYGVVGRGNRYSGFISSNRGETQEAYHGKNPILHAGKLYTVIAHRISRKIYELNHMSNKVLVTINNGSPISSPESVWVSFGKSNLDGGGEIEKIITKEINNISNISMSIINKDPISEFRNREILI